MAEAVMVKLEELGVGAWLAQGDRVIRFNLFLVTSCHLIGSISTRLVQLCIVSCTIVSLGSNVYPFAATSLCILRPKKIEALNAIVYTDSGSDWKYFRGPD